MEVFHDIKEIKGIAVALGYFDGIHIGHKKILSTLVQQAKINGIKCAVVTFDKNPNDYFSNTPTPAIQSFKDKELILDSMGIDYLFELNFEDYKELTAIEYIKNVLVKNFAPRLIVVGYNHTFGKDREGTPSYLRDYENKFGYECVVIPEQKYNDSEEVSSSIIRKHVQYGHLNAVKALLGRYFSVRNSVIKGDKRARALGYPTANLVWPNSMVKLPYGVYFGYAQVNSKMSHALISWGNKPTLTDGKDEILEVHINDFNEDIYGKIVKVIFVKKLRDEENFGGILPLKTQLQKDFNAFEKWVKLTK